MIMKNKHIIRLGLSFILPGIILIFPPLQLSTDQGIVLSALVLTIIWWATGVVRKSIASVFLLTVFSIWGSTPLTEIFRFPLSENFVLILFSFVFTEGIMNSGLTEKFIEPALDRGSKGIHSLLWIIIGLNVILIFVIPQPFARIIILGTILKGYFFKRKLQEELIRILMLYTFATAIVVNMMLIRGDIILNNALIAIAGIEISEVLWIKIMGLPTMFFAGFTYLLFYLLFKKELVKYFNETKGRNDSKEEINVTSIERMNIVKHFYQPGALTNKDKRNFWMILAVVFLWMTEPFHGIGSAAIIVCGTMVMALFGLIKKKDLKSVNLELLIFITAAFSIGDVISNSGVADILFGPLRGLLPKEFGILYLLTIMVISMTMHMVLGSNITTLSVVVPSLMLISEGTVPIFGLVFIIHVSVSTHYLLPFHNVILLIGNGKGFFDSKQVARYGLGLTLLFPIVLLGLYYTWWQIIGLL